jgi:ASCH domain
MSGQTKQPPVVPFPENHRALSMCQPFVEQVFRGEKKIEYRGFKTNVRGLVYIYATNKPRMDCFEDCGFSVNDVSLGKIVGTVEITDCTGVEGSYQWHLSKPKRFEKPIEAARHPQPSFFFAF